MSIKKSIFKIFNGSSWDEYYHKTSADQVVYTKPDGTASNVQAELAAQNSALDKIPQIQHGVNNVIMKANANATSQVYFTSAFSVAPNVVASVKHEYVDAFRVTVSSITTTGFIINFHNSTALTSSVPVTWIAIAG